MTEMNILEKVKQRLIKLKVPFTDLSLSDRPNKKIKIIINGKIIHYGDKNSHTYIEGADEKKRNAYRARASKIKNKNGQYTYLIKYTPNYLAYWTLW